MLADAIAVDSCFGADRDEPAAVLPLSSLQQAALALQATTTSATVDPDAERLHASSGESFTHRRAPKMPQAGKRSNVNLESCHLMSADQELSHTATKPESAAAKRETPKVFLALMLVLVVLAVGVMAISAKFIFH